MIRNLRITGVSLVALVLALQPAQASFTFLNATSGSVTAFSFDGSTTPAGTSNCASTTECPASVPINTAGLPLFTSTNPGFASLNATPSLANGNGTVPTQGGAVLSATNGGYSNILQGNAALSSSNPIFASLSGSTLPAFAATPTFNLGTLNGAATAANQEVTAAGTSASSAQGVQGVTGGIALPISAASLPLPTGAALETGGNLATTATNTGTVAGAVTSSVMQENLKQVNGITTLTGAGATGTGSQRVTVAQDVTTIAGAAPTTAGTASANVLSVQGVA